MDALSPSETASLIEAARAGERWAEEEIIRLIGVFARHLCRGSGTPESPVPEWEEVAQEASRRFFAMRLHRFPADGPLRSYLYTIVKGTRIQLHRSMARRLRRDAVALPDSEGGAGSVAETRTLLFRILRTLPDSCRGLLERLFFDGASHAEIASGLGLVESSVRSRATRCLQKAREQVR